RARRAPRSASRAWSRRPSRRASSSRLAAFAAAPTRGRSSGARVPSERRSWVRTPWRPRNLTRTCSSSAEDCAAATASRASCVIASTRGWPTNYRLCALAVSASFANPWGSRTAISARTLRSSRIPALLSAAMNREYESPTCRHAALMRMIERPQTALVARVDQLVRAEMPAPLRTLLLELVLLPPAGTPERPGGRTLQALGRPALGLHLWHRVGLPLGLSCATSGSG